MPESFTFLGEKEEEKSLDVLFPDIFQKRNYTKNLDKITNYLLKTKNDHHKKLGMEFLFINGKYKELQQLIIKNKHTNCPSNIEWAKVYQLMLKALKKDSCTVSTLNKLQRFKTKDPIVEILLEFTFAIIQVKTKSYKFIGSSLDKINHLMTWLTDFFLLKCFRKRIDEIMFHYYWSRNEVILARKLAFTLLNEPIDVRTKIRLHTNLGLTYIFDTYEQGIYHIQKAFQIAKQNEKASYIHLIQHHTIPFFSACFGKVEGVKTEAISEQAHLALAQGKRRKALKLLQQLNIRTPFQYYYLGLAKQDPNLLEKSYDMFIHERNDYFYSRLPLKALRTYS